LSQSIKRLELSLDVILLLRGHREVSLTESGRVYLGAAIDLLARARRAEILAKRAASEFAVLKINSFGPARHRVLPAALRAFLRRWPDVRIELKDHSHPPAQLADLRDGTADVAFVNTAMGDLQMYSDTDDLEFETIERWPLVAAVPSDNSLAQRGMISLRELRDLPFVMFPLNLAPRLCGAIVMACRQSGFVPKIRHEVAHVFSMLSLIAAGQGVALVRASARTLMQDGVSFLRLRDAPPYLYQDMAVGWMKAELVFPLDAFLDTVRKCRSPALSRDLRA
jgi:DNA-binding transcriptional LysR family regulator